MSALSALLDDPLVEEVHTVGDGPVVVYRDGLPTTRSLIDVSVLDVVTGWLPVRLSVEADSDE